MAAKPPCTKLVRRVARRCTGEVGLRIWGRSRGPFVVGHPRTRFCFGADNSVL